MPKAVRSQCYQASIEMGNKLLMQSARLPNRRRALWSVFLTHSLTVCERDEFYGLLGIDANRFDAEVMRQTNRTARRAFPRVFDLEGSNYLELRDRLVDCYQQIKDSSAKGPLGVLKQLGLKLRFAVLLLRQFAQPMVPSAAA